MNDTSAIVRIPQGCRPIACVVENAQGALGVLMAAPVCTDETLDEVLITLDHLGARLRGEMSAELPRVWFREGAFVPWPGGNEAPA
jgi:hypothetical protein